MFFLNGGLGPEKNANESDLFYGWPQRPCGPSRHETEKDLLVLQHCLDSVSNITGVKIVTRFIYKRSELDINDMKDVAAIVIESSAEGSSKNRVDPLFPPSPDNRRTYSKEVLDYLNQVDSLHKAGMGVVVLH